MGYASFFLNYVCSAHNARRVRFSKNINSIFKSPNRPFPTHLNDMQSCCRKNFGNHKNTQYAGISLSFTSNCYHLLLTLSCQTKKHRTMCASPKLYSLLKPNITKVVCKIRICRNRTIRLEKFKTTNSER